MPRNMFPVGESRVALGTCDQMPADLRHAGIVVFGLVVFGLVRHLAPAAKEGAHLVVEVGSVVVG